MSKVNSIKIVDPCRRCEIGPETPKQEIAELTSEDYGVNTFRLSMCGGSNEKRFKSDGDILDAFETIKAVGGVAQGCNSIDK